MRPKLSLFLCFLILISCNDKTLKENQSTDNSLSYSENESTKEPTQSETKKIDNLKNTDDEIEKLER